MFFLRGYKSPKTETLYSWGLQVICNRVTVVTSKKWRLESDLNIFFFGGGVVWPTYEKTSNHSLG